MLTICCFLLCWFDFSQWHISHIFHDDVTSHEMETWSVDSPNKGPVTRCYDFSLIYAWTNGWTNNGVTGDFITRHCNSSGLFTGTISCALLRHSVLSQVPLWPHQMETFSALLDVCEENSLVTCEFPSRRPVTRNLMYSLIRALTNGWVNNRDAGDLKRHRAHYDVIVMLFSKQLHDERMYQRLSNNRSRVGVEN